MRKVSVVGFIVIFLSGCTTFNKQALDETSISSLPGKSVVSSQRKKSDFVAFTADKAMFGMLGAMVAISSGNSLAEKNEIVDPANQIGIKLVNAMKTRYGSVPVEPSVDVSSDNAAEIAEAIKKRAQFILDVKTVNWGFTYFPTDWTHYMLFYSAKAQLIDVEAKRVVAEGFCIKEPPSDKSTAPTYDALLANQALMLKEMVSAASDMCVKKIQEQMFNADEKHAVAISSSPDVGR